MCVYLSQGDRESASVQGQQRTHVLCWVAAGPQHIRDMHMKLIFVEAGESDRREGKQAGEAEKLVSGG